MQRSVRYKPVLPNIADVKRLLGADDAAKRSSGSGTDYGLRCLAFNECGRRTMNRNSPKGISFHREQDCRTWPHKSASRLPA